MSLIVVFSVPVFNPLSNLSSMSYLKMSRSCPLLPVDQEEHERSNIACEISSRSSHQSGGVIPKYKVTDSMGSLGIAFKKLIKLKLPSKLESDAARFIIYNKDFRKFFILIRRKQNVLKFLKNYSRKQFLKFLKYLKRRKRNSRRKGRAWVLSESFLNVPQKP
ncbi:uncharacterized protein LOC114754158 [Neltuma alba]|uniref:uncharacterized protein LOC114754158 n=1 Tax=Neltuma alba TaxID=207710 RepID=UPI0010A388B4|nr:uncharacterized protein LOC114754158 [Prosopis alba]